MKYNPRELDIQKIKADYEGIIKEQKERILSLREENNQLKAALQEFQDKNDSIVAALVTAQQVSEQITAHAKRSSADIQRAAAEQLAKKQQAGAFYDEQLHQLRNTCFGILSQIDRELEKDAPPKKDLQMLG